MIKQQRDNRMPSGTHHRHFALSALAFFLVIGTLLYMPALAGRVPLPARLVTNFPAWHSVKQPDPTTVPRVDYGDLMTFFYPWRVLASRAFRQHELPQWNRHILGGTPLIASAQSAIFYPIHVLLYVLPVPAAWSLKLLLNVILAGFLTSMFARSIGAAKHRKIERGFPSLANSKWKSGVTENPIPGVRN